MANKNETLSNPGTGLMMSLLRNDSVANLYLIPSSENSQISAVVDNWNYPVKPFELRNNGFLKLVLNKELHLRKSTKSSPCTDKPDDNFYKVIL